MMPLNLVANKEEVHVLDHVPKLMVCSITIFEQCIKDPYIH